MQQLKLFPVILVSITLSCCAGHNDVQQTLTRSLVQSTDSISAAKRDSGLPVNNNSSQQVATVSSQPMMDTAKIKSALEGVKDLLKGKPDINKVKAVAADVLSADAAMLSDSGITSLGGNTIDPAVITAKNTLLKMRNAMGITPATLDSMKKSAAMLTKKTN